MVTGAGTGESAGDPLVGDDAPLPLGGDGLDGEPFGADVLGGEVLAGDDLVVLGLLVLDVGEFEFGVFVDGTLVVVDGSGVPVVVPGVVEVVTGVGTVLDVGEPVPDGCAGCVVGWPLVGGTFVVGSAVGTAGAVASTVTQ